MLLGLLLVISFAIIVGYKDHIGFANIVFYNALITTLALSGVGLFIISMVLIEHFERTNKRRLSR